MVTFESSIEEVAGSGELRCPLSFYSISFSVFALEFRNFYANLEQSVYYALGAFQFSLHTSHRRLLNVV